MRRERPGHDRLCRLDLERVAAGPDEAAEGAAERAVHQLLRRHDRGFRGVSTRDAENSEKSGRDPGDRAHELESLHAVLQAVHVMLDVARKATATEEEENATSKT